MSWRELLLEKLAIQSPGGYSASGEIASEPTALAGLALAPSDANASRRAALWLRDHQARDGSVGVLASQASPCWTTSLAILLWQRLNEEALQTPLQRAIAWSLEDRGETHAQRDYIGHNTTLVGWSWAEKTHSWLEPTAMFVLALKAVGKAQHSRTREAVKLLVDRLLPHGGCNYGNTIVLGQELLPHIQPTGIVLMALADEPSDDPRIERSLIYLERELSAETATASLCYGLLGLAAFEREPSASAAWLETRYNRLTADKISTYQLALLALALEPAGIIPGRGRRIASQ